MPLFDQVNKIVALALIARRFMGGRRAPEAPPTPQAEPAPPPPPPPRPVQGVVALTKTSVNRFLDDDCMTMAAALAYYTVFSIAPLLLVVIAIAGFIFGRQAVQHQITEQIQGLIGQGAASQVGAMVENAGQHTSTGVVSAVLGILALLFGATGAFAQLQSSLNRIWQVKPDPKKGGVKSFIGTRILSLGMVLALAFLLMVSLVVSATLSAFGSFLSSFMPKGFSGPVLQLLTQLTSLAIIAALFAAMFKVLPDAKISWRQAWRGGGITAVLFTIGKFLIGVYLGHSGAASAYGAAGSLVLIVLWIYYSSVILLIGAELTVVWSEARSGELEPKPGAIKVHREEIEHPPKAA